MLWAAVLLIVSLTGSQGQQQHIFVDPVNNMFIDAQGQHRVFHGLALNSNFALPSMTQAQMDTMVQWGMNVVRMGFHWHLYEIAPGVWNETYIDGVVSLANQFMDSGIYVIFDMHQDLWSPLYCGGHGLPSFYGGPYNTTEYQPGGSHAYPEPVAKPVYGPNGILLDCGNVSSSLFGWASSYITFAVGAAAQRLYDNDNGTLDYYGDFWIRVASRFQNESGVLAYEILNEPWLGDVYADPDLLLPGVADKKNLMRLNQAINDAIRSVDADRIIFYEPATGGNLLDATPVGYTELPGGADYQNRSALSYHIYCPLLESDMPYHPTNQSLFAWFIEAASLGICDLANTYQYDTRDNDVKRLGVAGFMTEFGAILSNNTFSMDYVYYATEKMDQFFHGWTFWYLTPDSGEPLVLDMSLARTYARRVSGLPKTMTFDHKSGNFTLSFVPSAIPSVFALPTEIYGNAGFYYPRGAAWTVYPEDAVEGQYNSSSGIFLFANMPSALQAPLVNITIFPL